MDNLEKLRKALIAERRARHISLRKMASILGCGKSTLYEFERGSGKTAIETVFAYAQVLEVEIEFSFGRKFMLLEPTSAV